MILCNIGFSRGRHYTVMGVVVSTLEKERCNCLRENFMTRVCYSSLENRLKLHCIKEWIYYWAFYYRLLFVFVNFLLGLSTTKNFTIVVRDRNDPPTSLTASAPLSVYENSLSGEYIGSLTTADQDVAQTHQYKIVDVVARGHRTQRYGGRPIYLRS